MTVQDLLSRARTRWLVALLLAALVLVAVPQPTARAQAETDFRFEGAGWGHGIGMSQYGAQGQALEGQTYEGILTHYYRDTTVGTTDAMDFDVDVGLSQSVKTVPLVSRGGPTALTFFGEDIQIASGELWLLEVEADPDDPAEPCRLTGPDDREQVPDEEPTNQPTAGATEEASPGRTGECRLHANPDPGARVQIDPGRTEVRDDAPSYHRGIVRARPVERDVSGSSETETVVHVTVSLDMESYLYGLAEVPYSWEMEALKAQAVAGRSYAMHSALSRSTDGGTVTASRRDACWCHVYDSVQDQVYKGWGRETGVYWDRWQTAVDTTAGQVVLAPGQPGTQVDGVVQAFYSSSTGGRTEAKHEVWGGDRYPYLVSVPDRWSVEDREQSPNPYRSWTASIPASTVADKVDLDEVIAIEVVDRNTSGSAASVRFVGTRDGESAEVLRSGTAVRTLLGLRSHYIDRVFLPPFVDDDGSPFEPDIAWLAAEGITDGCNAAGDRFCPEDTVLRGEMARFLVTAMGLTETSQEGEFDDVPEDGEFAEDINRLATAGITDGCGSGDDFCPRDAITRGEMARFLVTALELTETSEEGEFDDVPEDGEFAEDINRLATAGITQGCSSGTNDFCPTADVRRYEMAAFLARGWR